MLCSQGSGMLSGENDGSALRGCTAVLTHPDSAFLGHSGTQARGLPTHFLLSVATGFSPLGLSFKVRAYELEKNHSSYYEPSQYLLPQKHRPADTM